MDGLPPAESLPSLLQPFLQPIREANEAVSVAARRLTTLRLATLHGASGVTDLPSGPTDGPGAFTPSGGNNAGARSGSFFCGAGNFSLAGKPSGDGGAGVASVSMLGAGNPDVGMPRSNVSATSEKVSGTCDWSRDPDVRAGLRALPTSFQTFCAQMRRDLALAWAGESRAYRTYAERMKAALRARDAAELAAEFAHMRLTAEDAERQQLRRRQNGDARRAAASASSAEGDQFQPSSSGPTMALPEPSGGSGSGRAGLVPFRLAAGTSVPDATFDSSFGRGSGGFLTDPAAALPPGSAGPPSVGGGGDTPPPSRLRPAPTHQPRHGAGSEGQTSTASPGADPLPTAPQRRPQRMSVFGPIVAAAAAAAPGDARPTDTDCTAGPRAAFDAVEVSGAAISARLADALGLHAERCGFALDVESRRMVAVLRRQLRVWAALRRTVAAHTQRLAVLRDADLRRLELLLAPGLAAAQQLAGSAPDTLDGGRLAQDHGAPATIPPALVAARPSAAAGPVPPSEGTSASASPRRVLATAAGSTVTSQSRFG